MTTADVHQIIKRLDAQSRKIDELRADLDQIKGGLVVLKWIGRALGVGGFGALLAWMQGQAK